MRVIIRVDASHLIGSGHVMRCLTLADKMKRIGYDVLFLCRDLPGNCYELIKHRGHNYHLLTFSSSSRVQREILKEWHGDTIEAIPRSTRDDGINEHYSTWLGVTQHQDAEDVMALIQDQSFDACVVDHYALDYRWEQMIKPYVKHLLIIDDLATRRHDCAMLIDHNYYWNAPHRYDQLVPSTCIKLLGPDYALVNTQFYEIGKARAPKTKLERVLVFLGGVDIRNDTQRVVDALLSSTLKSCQIDVVLGIANPHQHLIKRRYAHNDSITLHVQPNDYPDLVAQADLAIGAGGVSALERLAARLPSIILCLAENQEQICQDMHAAGFSIYAKEGQDLIAILNAITIADLERLKNHGMLSERKGELLVDALKAMLE
jgi:UDP-2,4-diacetamido-2,4,6-trideoxy-beta-L-altropyranose hydrolase